jgi:hypothetical protein
MDIGNTIGGWKGRCIGIKANDQAEKTQVKKETNEILGASLNPRQKETRGALIIC